MKKATWDRSTCQGERDEARGGGRVCFCHDDSAPPYFCAACGCRPVEDAGAQAREASRRVTREGAAAEARAGHRMTADYLYNLSNRA